VRAWVEHTFHIVKNRFRHKKLRYRGLAKNTAQLHTLFALANLVIVKKTLLAQPRARSRPESVLLPEPTQENPSTKPISANRDPTNRRAAVRNYASVAKPPATPALLSVSYVGMVSCRPGMITIGSGPIMAIFAL
jgi:hypothetical protein